MKRILFAVLMTLTSTALTFAQRGRLELGQGGTIERGQPPDPMAGLKAALNLTDAQVEAIKALTVTRDERARALRTEIEQKRQTLDTLLDAASPIPIDVGNAAISLRGSQNKLAAERDWFIPELKKLLTGDQQQKLDTLLAANPRLPLFGLGGLGRGPRPQ